LRLPWELGAPERSGFAGTLGSTFTIRAKSIFDPGRSEWRKIAALKLPTAKVKHEAWREISFPARAHPKASFPEPPEGLEKRA
jgi:hypothetical protein